MKKLKNLTFACLLILGLAACADDDKSSNPPSYDDPTIIINDNHTAKIGETAEKTITFTNPYTSSANLSVYINNYNYSSIITVDKVKSTCSFRAIPGNTQGETYDTSIEQTLQAGESCTLIYNFAPTSLETELLELSVSYEADIKTICPTPDTVPTYEQVRNSNRYEDWYIYNYAEDNNGNKSSEYIHINIEFPVELTIGGSNLTDIDITSLVSYSKDFNLPAKQGDYSFNMYVYNGTLESTNSNCTISESNDGNGNYTLSVKNNNGCSLKVTTSYGAMSPIKFSPKQIGNPYYNVNIIVSTENYYSILDAQNNYNNTFSPYYTKEGLDTYSIEVGVLKNNEKITSYEITGTNADKFKVTGTQHNSCTVTDTEISIPQGQQNCFYTIEITDVSTTAEYTATLNTTLSTNATQIYNIKGKVSLLTIQDILQNYCKQPSQNKENNKAYKLF